MASYFRMVAAAVPTMGNSLPSYIYGVSSIIDELKLGGLIEIDHVDKMIPTDIVAFPTWKTYSSKFSIFKWSAIGEFSDVFIKIQYGNYSDGGVSASASNNVNALQTKVIVSIDSEFIISQPLYEFPYITNASPSPAPTGTRVANAAGNNILYLSDKTLIFASNNCGRLTRYSSVGTLDLPSCAFILERDSTGRVGVISSGTTTDANSAPVQQSIITYMRVIGSTGLGVSQTNSIMMPTKRLTLNEIVYQPLVDNIYPLQLQRFIGITNEGKPFPFNSFYYNAISYPTIGDVVVDGKTVTLLGKFGGLGHNFVGSVSTGSPIGASIGIGFIHE